MPDYIIPELWLYIEMKDVKPGKVKQHEEGQQKIRQELIEAGFHAYRCEGYKEAREKFEYHYSIYKQTSQLD
jgi:hypothetical protein